MRYSPKLSTQDATDASLAAALSTLPSTQFTSAGVSAESSEVVPPMELPPEVANVTTVLSESPACSANAQMICGAVYHQMGKPTKIVS